MNNSDYQRLPAISSHWLIEMLKSPADCWRKYLDPQRTTEEPTHALRFGTLVHCLALTPHQFEHEFIVADYERRSNAGKSRYAELVATGRTVVRPAELEKARAIAAALHADPDARTLLRGGKKERTIIQPRTNGLLPLKARLDIHQEARRQVVELKTTYSIHVVETAIARYRYLLSAAFYQNMVKGQSVVFVFVQTAPPHDVVVIPMGREQLQEGREQWQTALARFDQCFRANDWPEAAPIMEADDDDPLMLPTKIMPRCNGPRFDLPLGELAL
ncbi:MAG: PD-(D/E)XK nuclease-like domain-containing protein [Phycisphaerales bacterium]|nr:PD-(D/E)XK nuclease-like domain-containing protein [Phycisphaerales bacterium]